MMALTACGSQFAAGSASRSVCALRALATSQTLATPARNGLAGITPSSAGHGYLARALLQKSIEKQILVRDRALHIDASQPA
jgi:hypothetical protein